MGQSDRERRWMLVISGRSRWKDRAEWGRPPGTWLKEREQGMMKPLVGQGSLAGCRCWLRQSCASHCMSITKSSEPPQERGTTTISIVLTENRAQCGSVTCPGSHRPAQAVLVFLTLRQIRSFVTRICITYLYFALVPFATSENE